MRGKKRKYNGAEEDGIYLVNTQTVAVPVGGHDGGATLFCAPKRKGLYISRPLRVHAGDFGHHVKIGAGAKLISEVFTYLIILLRLRELRLSELQ